MMLREQRKHRKKQSLRETDIDTERGRGGVRDRYRKGDSGAKKTSTHIHTEI
jgi:hypothetical protein